MRGSIVPLLFLLAACDRAPTRPVSADGVRHDGALAAPSGAVPRGAAAERAVLHSGPTDTGDGAQGYRDFCAPCHGVTGRGEGPVIARGFTAPRSFASLSAEELAPARTVAIITSGYGAMLPQAEQVAAAERWAIARHVARLGADAR